MLKISLESFSLYNIMTSVLVNVWCMHMKVTILSLCLVT